jgi:glycerol-3-phosphate acyltransferase PlsY
VLNSVNLILLIIAYILGSIPNAVWIGRQFYSTDIREFGSGNAGATNTFRVLGKKAGTIVLILDILKGWVAVNLPYFYGTYSPNTSQFINLQLVLGVAALLGHIFPVFAGFRGGKGIATLLGIVIAMNYQAALVSIGVFLVFLFAFRYVSLASIIASVTFPLYLFLVIETPFISLKVFSVFIAVLVIITHQKNIERLLKGTESKAFQKSNVDSPDDEDDED